MLPFLPSFPVCSYLHGQGNCVENDERKDDILKGSWRYEPPDAILKSILWNVASDWFGFKRKLETFSLQKKSENINILVKLERIHRKDWAAIDWGITCLIFIQSAVFEFFLALLLKGDDNEADEDVHHEEGDDNDVDDKVDGDVGPVVEERPVVLLVGVDGFVGQAEEQFMVSVPDLSNTKRSLWGPHNLNSSCSTISNLILDVTLTWIENQTLNKLLLSLQLEM